MHVNERRMLACMQALCHLKTGSINSTPTRRTISMYALDVVHLEGDASNVLLCLKLIACAMEQPSPNRNV